MGSVCIRTCMPLSFFTQYDYAPLSFRSRSDGEAGTDGSARFEHLDVTSSMLSDFQEQKATYYFNLIDEDGNGLIEVNDFALRAQRLATAQDRNSEEARQKLRNQVVAWWEQICRIADFDGDDRVTLQEWKAYWESVQAGAERGDRSTFRTLEQAAREMLRTIDQDGTGRVTEEEYARWLEAWGAEGGEEAFRRLDRDGKGYLTEEDFVDALREFYLADRPGVPGNALYGPLPE